MTPVSSQVGSTEAQGRTVQVQGCTTKLENGQCIRRLPSHASGKNQPPVCQKAALDGKGQYAGYVLFEGQSSSVIRRLSTLYMSCQLFGKTLRTNSLSSTPPLRSRSKYSNKSSIASSLKPQPICVNIVLNSTMSK
mmetsp:Transcript_120/g.594  ORF Transcript_120/g.594 Transcript_120/m.594 type:complete len:136 (-) Transcript_120:2040-2447(-)